MKKVVQAFFGFSRKDRVGILVLLILMVLVFLFPHLWPVSPRPGPTPDTTWIAAVKKLETSEKEETSSAENATAYQYDQPYRTGTSLRLFYFDPNTLSQKGWEELGLRPRTIKTIQNYIAKGGHFYKAEDLKRIYGLSEEVYQRLYPFIRIESINAPVTSKEPRLVSTSKESRYRVIDINTADTTAFISLPGIGSRLATRIVNFRERLGGFYSIEQITEVYGLADSVFQKIKNYLKLETNSIKKININTASLEELKAHPYIRHAIAAPLVAYRNEHGLFVRIEDIKKVMAVTNEVYDKILHYLTL